MQFSQKFLQFLVRFSVKNFVREILRAFHKRIRSLFNLKISLMRNSSLATVSNGVNFLWKLSQLKMNRGFQSESIIQTSVHQYRVKSLWCKSVWKQTSQSLHVCKNRSVQILRQTSIVRFYQSLKFLFIDHSYETSIIIQNIEYNIVPFNVIVGFFYCILTRLT